MQDALLFDVITAMMIKPVKHFSRSDHGLAPLSQASRILNLLLSRIEKYIAKLIQKQVLLEHQARPHPHMGCNDF